MALKIAAHRRFAENGGVCLILHAKDIDKIADILDNPRKTNPGTFLFDSSQSHKAPIENIVLALKARLQNQSPQDLTRGRPLSPLYVLKNPATETL